MIRFFLVAVILLAGCGPKPVPVVDAGTDGGPARATDCLPPPLFVEDVSACVAPATDYQPRVAGSANDPWPACISDDNAYHPISANISSIARITAFEQIAALLWREARIPSAQDFIDARVLYAQAEGLDSRVQRREDVHFPAPQSLDGGTAPKCSDVGVPEQFPDRCVGPARLLPILNDAFARGASGEAPRLHAARIEAALLWFFYASALSEVTSCAARPQDCDSAWAYYAGGTPRGAPIGLGGALWSLAPQTHQRAYDAMLAVRCWRNLDNETGAAANLTLQRQARDQLDRALVRGIAVIARQRVAELACSDAQGTQARLGFFRTIAPLLDREARVRDAGQADRLAVEPVDAGAVIQAIDALFPCP